MGLTLMCLAACVLAPAQVGAPLAGLVRTAAGTVRPVHGVAGSFILGEPLMEGVEALHFDGSGGWARSGGEVLILGRDGEVLRRVQEQPAREEIAVIEGDELVLRASGRRLRLPFAVDRIERAGAEYLALSGSEGRLLARITHGREALFVLPEAAQ